MIRTQIQLTEEQARLLKEIASERGVSVAELIRQGASKMIEVASGIDPKERIKRAMEIAGRYHSRKSDVSSKHDRYLAQTYQK